MHKLSRPFGTYPVRTADPTLKRWAIVISPFGTGRNYGGAFKTRHTRPEQARGYANG
jgi:hypothetical protein